MQEAAESFSVVDFRRGIIIFDGRNVNLVTWILFYILPSYSLAEYRSNQPLPAKKRYEYFIKKIANFEGVWSLYADDWATTTDKEGRVLIPFWPNKEFAKVCAIDSWKNYKPEKSFYYGNMQRMISAHDEKGWIGHYLLE